MVQLPSSDKRRQDPSIHRGAATAAAAAAGAAADVKLEVEDPLEDEHGPANKRSKSAAEAQVESATEYNILDEPSPLGLRLRKSPSLMDLIEMTLNQAKKNEQKAAAASGTADKMKASNFPLSLLRIGSWERTSQYENDLVAKCYFAKHKLVWEVLEAGLKSKIEIQWSDITGLRASFPENKPGTLDIVLARPPLFFRETDPQPRKHTLWQATQDFTDGQASIHRRHFLQCSQSLLIKNFEKLIQCDPRLYVLSQQPEVILDCPCFEPRSTFLEDQDDSRCQGLLDYRKDDCASTFSGFCSSGSPYARSPISNDSGLPDSVGNRPDFASRDTSSPCSGIEAGSSEGNSIRDTEEKNSKWWDQLKVPGLRGSMSMTDLVNHLDHHIAEQMTSGNLSLSDGTLPSKEALEDVAQYLLNDSEAYTASDEQTLISRVNSFCCLLQKDTVSAPPDIHVHSSEVKQQDVGSEDDLDSTPDDEPIDLKPPMTRKESFGELLILPRIASLPQFLFDASGDAQHETR